MLYRMGFYSLLSYEEHRTIRHKRYTSALKIHVLEKHIQGNE